nr:zinc finger, CCHC-type [Tanacetum cinerariifolium]
MMMVTKMMTESWWLLRGGEGSVGGVVTDSRGGGAAKMVARWRWCCGGLEMVETKVMMAWCADCGGSSSRWWCDVDGGRDGVGVESGRRRRLVVYVLTSLMPKLVKDATVEAIRKREKWENDDYICRGHILNDMSDSLFDVYTNVELAKGVVGFT